MSREMDARRAIESQGEGGSGVAAGKATRVGRRYPALAQTLGGQREPTIHDAATAAVEHKGGGAPVDAGVASRVGAHLGADFSGVRVHEDPLSREATQAMGARAFAYGGDVFLGPGESGGDLGLMAHELTHVAQQGAAGQRAPQRAVQVGDANTPAEQEADRVSAAVTGGKAPAGGGLLVDEPPVGPGQVLKSQFLSSLRAAVDGAMSGELGPESLGGGCPPVDQFFQRSGAEPARAVEARLRPLAPGATSAAELEPAVVAGLRQQVAVWRATGQVPAELGAVAPAVAAGPAQAQALRAPDGRETLASLEAELGPGQPLDGATASRMGALGDLSSVRVHTGATAARKAADAGAVAFAVGGNVVMGASAPAAGTLAGDALLAHELAHTAQQADAARDPDARRQPIGGEDATAEEHADQQAGGVMATLRGVASRVTDAFKTGLQLQRCDTHLRDHAAVDASRVPDATLQGTAEYKRLVGSMGANPADALLACRLVIRAISQGTNDFDTNAATYLQRARDQRASAGAAEGMENQLGWAQFQRDQLLVDPSQVDSDFSQWAMAAHDNAPSSQYGVMNCYEFVMFAAYEAGVVSRARIREIFATAVDNFNHGRKPTFGATFEDEFRASNKIDYDHTSPGTTPRPLRGDIVIFDTAAGHMAIATGNIVQNGTTGADECEIMSLWTQNGRRVFRTTIEHLIAHERAGTPARFWTARWS